MTPPLREYQRRAVGAARGLLSRPAARVCLVAPTGAGKTRIALAIADGEDALWLVPSTALRKQAPGRAVTVQSLLGGDRPSCSLLIADECHHLAGQAEQWSAVARDYPRVLGLTATPSRHDGAPLGDQFDHLVVAASYSELLAGGYLVPCRAVMPVDRPDEDSGLAEHPVAAWKRYAGGRRGFAFFGRVALAERFAAAVPRSGVIIGEQSEDVRAVTMARFRDGELDVLASVATLTEGVDVPDAAVCLLAVQPAHEGSYLQRVGRVLRPAPGKADALLIDLPGAAWRYGFPTDDRTYSLSGSAIRRTDGAPAISQCLECGAVYLSAPVCPECGWVRPARVRPPQIWGAPMETIDPSTLTREQRAKLTWRDRMLGDDTARLAWLRRRAHHAGHAAALHRSLFGAPLPRAWWPLFGARR